MKFKAAILTELNSPLTVDYVETTELSVGQVLVKILTSGLCGAQLQEISGLKGNAAFLPHLLGHEGCGIVQDIGPGVSTVKIGSKVVMHWRKGAGIESSFPIYKYNNKKISSGKVTTLSEYSVVSENRLTAVNENTSPELCALLGCGLTTALGVINNEANLKFGESILVLGAGGVGLNLIQAAKLASAYPIYSFDAADKKHISILNGATEFVNDLSKLKNVDVIIDTTGNQKVIQSAMSVLGESGRFILVGQPKPDQEIIIPNGNKLFDGDGKTIKATQGGKTIPSIDIPRYVKLYNAGIINTNNIITHRLKLDNINEAINILKSGNAGRIIINIYE